MRDILSIDTPENVTIGYEIAGIGSRIVAYGLDFIIRWTPFLALLLVLLLAGYIITDVGGLGVPVMVLLAFVFLGLHTLYFILFEGWMRGQTPGKRIAGIRVVMENGRPAPMAPIVARNLLRVVELLVFAYAPALIVMFINRKSQRIGDLVAGTVVVKERAYSRKSVEELGYALAEAREPSVEMGVAISHEEYELVQRYLSRYATLAAARREALGRTILSAVLARQSASAVETVEGYAARQGTVAALREVALHFARDHQ